MGLTSGTYDFFRRKMCVRITNKVFMNGEGTIETVEKDGMSGSTRMVRMCSRLARAWPHRRRCSQRHAYRMLLGDGITLKGGGAVPPSSK